MNTSGSDVIVVGGGIAGISTAYYLAQSGIQSTVFERDGLASHASGFAYGGLSGGIPNGPQPNQPVIEHSMQLFKQLPEELAERTKVDIQFQNRPALRIALNPEEASALQQQLKWQQAQPGYQVQWLSSDAARALEPRISPQTVGGLHIVGGYDVEPYRLTLALAEAAETMGTSIRTGNVTGLESEKSRAKAISIGREKISADAIVLAMGPWSSIVTEWTGVEIPINPLKGQILRLKTNGEPYPMSIGHLKNYAMTKPSDGYVWCGTTEENAGFDETITTNSRDAIVQSTLLMLPDLIEAEIVLQTACLRPVAIDNSIILGRVPGFENLYIATGGGRQGIMMGPAMGNIMSRMISGAEPLIDINPYYPGRFI